MELDERIALVCAFRYALGRRTYVTDSVANVIIKVWDELPRETQLLIRKEIINAINNNDAGMDIDVKCWEKILELK